MRKGYVNNMKKSYDFQFNDIFEQDSTQEQTKEQPKVKEQTEWEKYGMSEYDYYHKPMWNWARVDYPTHEACIEAGEALGYEILSYSCLNINSTSGDYLGDMLKVKYPE